MLIQEYETAKEFIEACQPWLESREDVYNGLISTSQMIAQNRNVFSSPYWFGSVLEVQEVIGCGIYAEPDGLILSDMPEAAIGRLAARIDAAVGQPRRIVASPTISSSMALWWSARNDANVLLENRWNIYRVDVIGTPSNHARGTLRLATQGDLPTAAEWGHNYGREKPAPVNVAEFLVRKLKEHSLYIWDDNGARSIAAVSCKTRNGVRISAVYTPERFRGQSYASTIVAALCKRLLATDVDFITLAVVDGDFSERIYQKLGFMKIGTRDCLNLSCIGRNPKRVGNLD